MALIFALSSIPGARRADDFSVGRPDTWLSTTIQNALHVPTYGLLASLWWFSLRPWIRNVRFQALAALLIAGSYGVLDELHQSFVPGRSSSIQDMALDLVGALAGLWFFGYVCSRRERGPEGES